MSTRSIISAIRGTHAVAESPEHALETYLASVHPHHPHSRTVAEIQVPDQRPEVECDGWHTRAEHTLRARTLLLDTQRSTSSTETLPL